MVKVNGVPLVCVVCSHDEFTEEHNFQRMATRLNQKETVLQVCTHCHYVHMFFHDSALSE